MTAATATLAPAFACQIDDPAALAEAAKWVARVLPTRGLAPVLYGIKLEVAGNALRLSAFDFENAAEVEIPAAAGLDGDQRNSQCGTSFDG